MNWWQDLFMIYVVWMLIGWYVLFTTNPYSGYKPSYFQEICMFAIYPIVIFSVGVEKFCRWFFYPRK